MCVSLKPEVAGGQMFQPLASSEWSLQETVGGVGEDRWGDWKNGRVAGDLMLF